MNQLPLLIEIRDNKVVKVQPCLSVDQAKQIVKESFENKFKRKMDEEELNCFEETLQIDNFELDSDCIYSYSIYAWQKTN